MDAQEKRLAELKQAVPRRGIDRHAYKLEAASDLPADLQSPALALLAGRAAMEPVIVFPPQIQRGWQYVPRQALLFTPTGLTHVLASIWPDQGPRVTFLDRGSLMYLKASLLLLYGYLEIVGRGQDAPIRIGVEFNTVAWGFLSSPVRQFLKADETASRVPIDPLAVSPDTRRALAELPLKFANGSKLYGLLPGEQLDALLFQTGVSNRWLDLLRQPVTADTLLLLTTHYLVVIQEDSRARQGWILSYFPRNCICEIRSRYYGLWRELSIQLERGGQSAICRLPLAPEAAEAWHRQWVQHGGQWQES